MDIAQDPAVAATDEPVTVEAVLEQLAALQSELDETDRPDGLRVVNQLLTDVTRAIRDGLAGSLFLDREFAATLTVELVKRYLRAVRNHSRGAPAARAWQVLLDRRRISGVGPRQFALAGVNAVVDHDLAPALVSTCTVLGSRPGAAERFDIDSLAAVITQRLRIEHGAAADDALGIEFLVSRHVVWRQAEHLWALRGRPAEAETEAAAIDWRAGMVGLGLLGGEPTQP